MELKLEFLKEFVLPTGNQGPKSHRRNNSAVTWRNTRLTHKSSFSDTGKFEFSEVQKGKKTERTQVRLDPNPGFESGRYTNRSKKQVSMDRPTFLTPKFRKNSTSPMKTAKRLKSAISKVNHFNSKQWMAKHNSRNNEESNLIHFASEFLSILDHKNLNKISGSQLLEQLLSLGIATDSQVLKETLSMTFECKDIEAFSITLQDFLSLFRSDLITDLILKQLNEFASSSRQKSRVLKQIHEKMKILGEHRFSIFSSTQKSRIIPKDLFEIKKDEKMITINEHLEVVQKLWQKFFKGGDEGLTLPTVCEVFKFFKIFQDNFECKKYVLAVLGQVNGLWSKDFQRLFAKSMLKGAFVNLSKRLFEGVFADKDMSLEFKISSYQRALLMSGVKCPNSSISIEEGQMTVRALEKYKISKS